MGNQVLVVAKESANLAVLNQALVEKGLDGYSFTTEDDLVDWLHEINTNPNYRLLKPTDHDMRMDELRASFPTEAVLSQMDFDVAFGRTSEEDALKLCEVLSDPAVFEELVSMSYPEDVFELLEREGTDVARFQKLRKLDPRQFTPDEERRQHPTGGVYLAKRRWGDDAWLLYGNVERPEFYNDDVYIDPDHNPAYRDDEGRYYILMPLMPLGPQTVGLVNKHYQRLRNNLGVDIDFRVHAICIYGQRLANWRAVLEEPEGEWLSEEDAVTVLQHESQRHPMRAGHGGLLPASTKKGKKVVEFMGRCERSDYDNMNYAATTLYAHYGWGRERIWKLFK